VNTNGWLWIAVVFGWMLLLTLPICAVGQEEAPCTIHVQPGESIQASIDAAPEGAVICLSEGTWLANLEIAKSLTIRGAGTSKTSIKGPSRSLATISVHSQEEGKPIVVKISGLSITGDYEGLMVTGSAEVTITRCNISENYWGGITVADNAQATIIDSIIVNHHDTGIAIAGAASATIIDCEVFGNHWGILLNHSAHARILHVEIKDNHWGIWALAKANVSVERCDISHNEFDGIRLQQSVHINLDENRVAANRWYGVGLYASPCFDTDELFTGYVTGKNNIIPGSENPEGNEEGAFCPNDLYFLTTKQGGELDQREQE
jgi:parallel beta-helix repeat protein